MRVTFNGKISRAVICAIALALNLQALAVALPAGGSRQHTEILVGAPQSSLISAGTWPGPRLEKSKLRQGVNSPFELARTRWMGLECVSGALAAAEFALPSLAPVSHPTGRSPPDQIS